MNSFWKSTLASLLGTFLAFVIYSIVSTVFFIIALVGMAGAFSNETTPVNITDNTVLYLDLNRQIADYANTSTNPYLLLQEREEVIIVSDVIKAIKKAKDDKHIAGIVINGNNFNGGITMAYEIRKALEDFKASKKFIYAYADSYSQGGYYLSSLADKIYINPEGMLGLEGLVTAIPHFKNFLDKIGVEVVVFKVGTFKSAVEPFILPEMSEANRLQTQVYLGSIWGTMAQQIGKSRKKDVAAINQDVDSLLALDPTPELKKLGYVDEIAYEFDFEKQLKKKLEIDEDDDINYVTYNQYLASATDDTNNSSNVIAIYYAEGEIGEGQGIDAKNVVGELLDIAKDDDIKGLVFRVNSPGGSAYDSEQIWAALQEVKKAGKPFVVSMGNYAASGGYYISCSADYIFAEPTTLTGSIGIFGQFFNASKASNELGINFNTVSTNQNSAITPFIAMNDFQKNKFQTMVNRGYELFTKRCADGRKMPQDSLKKIAEGRVWDGITAKKIGLVDNLGGVEEAIKKVAELAKLKDDYRTDTYPVPQTWFELISANLQKSAMSIFMPKEYMILIDNKRMLENIVKQDNLQARAFIEVKL